MYPGRAGQRSQAAERTGHGGHQWADRGEDQKRCSGCSTAAVRRWRPDGDSYDLAFFASDGTQIPVPLPCAQAAVPRPARTGRRELFWVYAELADGSVTERLARAAGEEHLTSWRLHLEPPFVSLRIIADSMSGAQDVARAMVIEAARRAGLGEPGLGEVIAIPVGQAPGRALAIRETATAMELAS